MEVVCAESDNRDFASESLARHFPIVQHQWSLAKWQLGHSSHHTSRAWETKCRPVNSYMYVVITLAANYVASDILWRV